MTGKWWIAPEQHEILTRIMLREDWAVSLEVSSNTGHLHGLIQYADKGEGVVFPELDWAPVMVVLGLSQDLFESTVIREAPPGEITFAPELLEGLLARLPQGSTRSPRDTLTGPWFSIDGRLQAAAFAPGKGEPAAAVHMTLDLVDSGGEAETAALSELEELRGLSVLHGRPSPTPEIWGRMEGLEYLDLGFSFAIHDLSGVAALPRLRILDLTSNDGITDLSPLARTSSLEWLEFGSMGEVRDLSPLAELPRLNRLFLEMPDEPLDITPLGRIQSLERLELTGWHSGLEDLSPLSGLQRLRWLDLSGAWVLTDLAPLAALSGLEHLDLGNVQSLRDLTPLASLKGLRGLVLGGNPEVTDLSPLKGLPKLEGLVLYSLPGARDLSPVATLPSLRRLTLRKSDEWDNPEVLDALEGVEVVWAE